jgi:hypothetical protein
VKALPKLALLLVAIALPALADSVTTKDNLTLFGHVEQLDSSRLKLTARFPSQKGVETKELEIPRSEIVKIEFNATTFNPGAPPPGLLPGSSKATATSNSTAMIVLRGGQQQKCDGALIDGPKVYCGKQEWERALTIRIVLGGG